MLSEFVPAPRNKVCGNWWILGQKCFSRQAKKCEGSGSQKGKGREAKMHVLLVTRCVIIQHHNWVCVQIELNLGLM